MTRRAPGDSDTGEEVQLQGQHHHVADNEPDAPPEPHAPSEAEEVPKGRKERSRQRYSGANEYEHDGFKKNERGWHLALSRAGRLTVKLRGRTEAPHGAEGAPSLSARGAKPQAHHGPLQRLLEVALARSGRTRTYHVKSPVATPMSNV